MGKWVPQLPNQKVTNLYRNNTNSNWNRRETRDRNVEVDNSLPSRIFKVFQVEIACKMHGGIRV